MNTRSSIAQAQQKCAEARRKIAETKFENDQERREFANWFLGLQTDFINAIKLLTNDMDSKGIASSKTTIEIQATKDAAQQLMSHFLSLCVLKTSIDRLFLLFPNLGKYEEDNDAKEILSGAFHKGSYQN